MAATHIFRFPGPLFSPVLLQGSRAPVSLAGSVSGHGGATAFIPHPTHVYRYPLLPLLTRFQGSPATAGAMAGSVSGHGHVTAALLPPMGGSTGGAGHITAPIRGSGALAGSMGGSSHVTFVLSPATHYYRSPLGVAFCPILFAGHFTGLLAPGGGLTGHGYVTAALTGKGALASHPQGQGQLTGAFDVATPAAAHFFTPTFTPQNLISYRCQCGTMMLMPEADGHGTVTGALIGIAGISSLVSGHSGAGLSISRVGANFQWIVPGFLQQPKNLSGAATGTIAAQLFGQGAAAATLKGTGRLTSATGGHGTLAGILSVPGGLFGILQGKGNAQAPGTGIGVLAGLLPAKGTLIGTVGKAGAGSFAGHGSVLAALLGQGTLQGVSGGKGSFAGALWGSGNHSTGGHGNVTAVLRGASGLLGSVAGHSQITAGHNLISGMASGHGTFTTFLLGQMGGVVTGSGTVHGRAKRKRKPPHKNRVDLL